MHESGSRQHTSKSLSDKSQASFASRGLGDLIPDPGRNTKSVHRVGVGRKGSTSA